MKNTNLTFREKLTFLISTPIWIAIYLASTFLQILATPIKIKRIICISDISLIGKFMLTLGLIAMNLILIPIDILLIPFKIILFITNMFQNNHTKK